MFKKSCNGNFFKFCVFFFQPDQKNDSLESEEPSRSKMMLKEENEDELKNGKQSGLRKEEVWERILKRAAQREGGFDPWMSI